VRRTHPPRGGRSRTEADLRIYVGGKTPCSLAGKIFRLPYRVSRAVSSRAGRKFSLSAALDHARLNNTANLGRNYARYALLPPDPSIFRSNNERT